MKEGAPEPAEQSPEAKLSPKAQFKVLLGMFGTEKAREVFIEKCKGYLHARTTHEALSRIQDTENYSSARNVSYSGTSRANLHNDIMHTITMIATETKTPTPEQEAVLRNFHSRDNVAAAIKDYVFSEQDKEYYDEDEEEFQIRNKRDMSGPAYFHNLGKGQ